MLARLTEKTGNMKYSASVPLQRNTDDYSQQYPDKPGLLNYILLIASLIVASCLTMGASGGGCLGTQKNITVLTGSSGGFLLITPTNSANVTVGLTPRMYWNPYPSDLTSYTLQISLNSSFTPGQPNEVYTNRNIRRDAIAFDMPTGALQQNTIYYWRVIAVDADTATSTIASNAPYVFKTGIIPGQFSLLDPVNNVTLYNSMPTLIWQSSAQATYYNIQIDTEPTFNEPNTISTTIPSLIGPYPTPPYIPPTTYAVPASLLQSGITYYWRVRAFWWEIKQNTSNGLYEKFGNAGEALNASNGPFQFYVADKPGTFLLSLPTNNATPESLTPTFSWTSAFLAADYTIQFSLTSTFGPANNIYEYSGITETSYAMPDGIFTNETNYFWRVVATNGIGDTYPSNNYSSFRPDISPKPFSLSSPVSGSMISNLAPTFNWTISRAASEYLLEISTVPNFTTVVPYPAITSTSYTISPGTLVDNQIYWWRVRAINPNVINTAIASNAPFSFQTNIVPGTFTLTLPISGSIASTLTPTFQWTSAPLANTYRLEISESSINFTNALTYTNITTASYTVYGGLENGKIYWWRVVALSAETDRTNLPANAPFRFSINVAPLGFTLSLPTSATVFSVTTPSFSWTPAERATFYILQIAQSTNFSPSNLIYNTSILPPPSPPPAPAQATIPNPYDSAVNVSSVPQLSWIAANGATSYDVYFGTTNPPPYQTSIAGTVYTPSACNLETTFYWRINPRNGGGITTGAVWSFTTRLPPAAPTPPTPDPNVTPPTQAASPNPNNAAANAVAFPQLSWASATRATSYEVYFAAYNPPAYRTTTTGTSYNPGTLNYGTTFYWRIDTQNSGGITTGAVWSFTTQQAPIPPLPPPPPDPVSTIPPTAYTLSAGILTSGNIYWWRVLAFNSYNENSPTIALNAPLLFSVNVKPRSFALSMPISGSILSTLTPALQWGPSTLATVYYLRIAPDELFSPPLVYENRTITTTSFTVPQNALSMGKSYWWNVTAENGFDSTPSSNGPYSFRPTTAPLNFYLVSPNTDSILNTLTPSFTWTSSVYATTYTLQISTLLSFGTLLYEKTSISSDITSIQISSDGPEWKTPSDKGFKTARTYYWRVIASNNEAQGQTQASNAPFTLTTQVFPTAFDLIEPSNGSTQYTLSPIFRWSDSTIVDTYALQIALTSTFSSLVFEQNNIPKETTTITLPSNTLQPNGSYYWRVIAWNASGNTTATSAPFQFRAGAPPEPFDLATPISGSVETVLKPTLTWNMAPNAFSYAVEISEYRDFTPSITYRNSTIPSSTLAHQIPLNILAVRRDYFWRVIASNEFGETMATNAPFEFETFSPSTPPEVFNLLTPAHEASIPTYTPILSWSDSRGEISYRLEIVTNTDYFNFSFKNYPQLYIHVQTEIPKNTTTVTLPINALPDIGRYYWRVIATNEFGETIAANALFTPFAMIVDPSTSPWKPISLGNFRMFNARTEHSAVWTGNDVIIWGGKIISGSGNALMRDGVRYNPGLDTWDYINDQGAPSTRTGHTAIWTGTYMIIWGGSDGVNFLNDGAMYDPNTDTWTPLGDEGNAPAKRKGHIAVWAPSMNEMIIWGGFGPTDSFNLGYLDSGARYNLGSNTWTPMASSSTNEYFRWVYNSWNWPYGWYQQLINRSVLAPAGRDEHTAVWDNASNRLLIWGGKNNTNPALDTGGIYKPSSNTWWEYTYPAANTPVARTKHTAIWSGSQMYIFGGTDGQSYFPTSTSSDGRYTPANPPEYDIGNVNEARSIYNDYWTPFATENLPTSRTGHTAIWTGDQMIVWGGKKGGANYFNTGASFSSSGNYWTSMVITENTPAAREKHIAVWTGSEMFIWGGENTSGYLNSGAKYNPVTGSWVKLEVPVIGPPESRELHTIVFTSYDLNWQEPVLDKDTLSPPLTPKVGDRYLINGTAATTTAWAGQDFNVTAWDGSNWVFTSRTAKMSVYVRDENVTYKFDGTTWNLTDISPEVIVWGGYNGSKAFRSGARYNALEDSWLAMRQSSAPTERYGHTAVWTNPITATLAPRMLVWGGFNPPYYVNDGGEYLPGKEGGFWNTITTANAPNPRAGHSAVWTYDSSRPDTSNEMIVWGGYNGLNYLNDGGRYDLVSKNWTPTTLVNSPDIRRNHTAIWANTITPTKMVIWGGLSTDNNRLSSGGNYIPVSNTWETMADAAASIPGFARRDGHTSVWTGSTEEEKWSAFQLLSTNDIGRFSSIALDSNRNVHIASYNYTYGDLQYTTNAPSGTWLTTTLDNSGDVGEYCSIALNLSNPTTPTAHISYYDRTNGRLKYATNASGSWVTAFVESSPTTNHGMYSDVAVGPTGDVHISYYDWTNTGLKYAIRSGGGWSVSPVDNATSTSIPPTDVGQYTSIAVDTANKAYISYYDSSNARLKWATVDAGAILVGFVDTSLSDTGMYSSIAVDSNKRTHISYYNRSTGRLRYTNNVSGSFLGAIVEPDPDTASDLGLFTSIAINSNPPTTTVHISYYDKTNGDLKYISKNLYSSSWETPIKVDEIGDVGQYTSLAVDQFKKSYISYYDSGSGNLKYAANAWSWRNKMIVWGGFDGTNYLNTGAMYDPVGNSWRSISAINAPSKRAYHNAVFAEWVDSNGRNRSELIVWGGWNGSQYLYDGGHYNPALDQWTPINTVGAPIPRAYHAGLWLDFMKPDTGRRTREMIIWGGAISGGFTLDGSRYKP